MAEFKKLKPVQAFKKISFFRLLLPLLSDSNSSYILVSGSNNKIIFQFLLIFQSTHLEKLMSLCLKAKAWLVMLETCVNTRAAETIDEKAKLSPPVLFQSSNWFKKWTMATQTCSQSSNVWPFKSGWSALTKLIGLLQWWKAWFSIFEAEEHISESWSFGMSALITSCTSEWTLR